MYQLHLFKWGYVYMWAILGGNHTKFCKYKHYFLGGWDFVFDNLSNNKRREDLKYFDVLIQVWDKFPSKCFNVESRGAL